MSRGEDATATLAFEVLERVSSTMDVARARVRSGLIRFDALGRANLTGVLAHEQYAGRGQRARTWFARPAKSLCATFFLPGDLTPQPGSLALLAGAALAEAVEKLRDAQTVSPHSVLDIGLKWPNDLLLNGRKAGGILIEIARSPDGAAVALVGIGLNVSLDRFPPEIENATSLAREGLQIGSPAAETARPIGAALQRLAACCRQEGFPAVRKVWQRFDRTAGMHYVTEESENDGGGTPVVATGVSAEGALQARLPDGREVLLLSASRLRVA